MNVSHYHVRATLLIAGLGWLATMFTDGLRSKPDASGWTVLAGSAFIIICLGGIASAYYSVRHESEAAKSDAQLSNAEWAFGLVAVALIWGAISDGIDRVRAAAGPVVAKPPYAQNHLTAAPPTLAIDASGKSAQANDRRERRDPR